MLPLLLKTLDYISHILFALDCQQFIQLRGQAINNVNNLFFKKIVTHHSGNPEESDPEEDSAEMGEHIPLDGQDGGQEAWGERQKETKAQHSILGACIEKAFYFSQRRHHNANAIPPSGFHFDTEFGGIRDLSLGSRAGQP